MSWVNSGLVKREGQRTQSSVMSGDNSYKQIVRNQNVTWKPVLMGMPRRRMVTWVLGTIK